MSIQQCFGQTPDVRQSSDKWIRPQDSKYRTKMVTLQIPPGLHMTE